MVDKDKKPKTDKVLGQDPFEDLFGSGWEKANDETTTDEATTGTDQAADSLEVAEEEAEEHEREPITEIGAKETTESLEAVDDPEPKLDTTTEIEAEIDYTFESLVLVKESKTQTELAIEDDQTAIPEESDVETAPIAEIETEDELEPEFKALAAIKADEIEQAFEPLILIQESKVETAPAAEIETEDELEPEFKAIAKIETAEIDNALEAITMAEGHDEATPVAVVEAEDDSEPELEPTTEVEAEPAEAFRSFVPAEPKPELDPTTEVEVEPAEAFGPFVPAEPKPELEPVTEVEAEPAEAFGPFVPEDEPEIEAEPVAAVEAEEETKSEFEPAIEVEAEIDHALEALAEAQDDSELEIEPATGVEAEMDQAFGPFVPEDEPEVETAIEVEAEDDSESEIEPIIENAVADDQTTELPEAEEAEEILTAEENSNVLNEIIASIDDEIEQSHETDLMVTIEAEASGRRSENLEQYLIFTLAGAMYAAPATNVREVGEMANLTPVPNVPDWLLGVTNLRGDVLSVVDLHTFLSLEQPDYLESLSRGDPSFSGEQAVLVVHPRNDASLMTTGLVVDEVNDIRYLTKDRIIAPAAPIEDQVGSYLRGVYEDEDQLLVVLDFERLLLSPEMRQFEPL